MKLISVGISVIGGLVLGVFISWNGMGWVLNQTTLDVLKDPTIVIVLKSVAVVFIAPTIAGIITWIVTLFSIIMD